MGKNTSSFFDTDWLEIQKKYMDALASFGLQSGDTESSVTFDTPWHKALDFWWQSVQSSIPDQSQAIFSHLMQQSKSFYSVTEQFAQMMTTLAATTEGSSEWQSLLNESIKKMQEQLINLSSVTEASGEQIRSVWQAPYESWQRCVSSIMGEQWDTSLTGKKEDMPNVVARLMTIPGIGYTRESQDQIQQALSLW